MTLVIISMSRSSTSALNIKIIVLWRNAELKGLHIDLGCVIREAEDRVGVVYKRSKEKGGLWVS